MKRWQFWVGVGISALFLWVALRGLQLDKVLEFVQRADLRWILPGVAVYFVAVWARAWRWHYLLRPIKDIPTKTMFPIVTIGYMGNNIYPARAGELLRAYVLKKDEDVAISSSLATILTERVFDGLVMLAFVFVNLSQLPSMSLDLGFLGTVSISALAVGGAILFVIVLIVFFWMALVPESFLRIFSWFNNHLIPEKYRQKVLAVMRRFLEGFASLRSFTDVTMVFVTTIIIWLLETGKYWFLMHAFPFEVSFFALMLMNGIVNLATTIPSAPGYVGTFDAPGIEILKAFGVEGALAAAYTFVLHVALWLPITALGAYYMIRDGLSWTQIQAETSAKDGA